jgi:hypothetical protein
MPQFAQLEAFEMTGILLPAARQELPRQRRPAVSAAQIWPRAIAKFGALPPPAFACYLAG